jgi:hypothetical protein
MRESNKLTHQSCLSVVERTNHILRSVGLFNACEAKWSTPILFHVLWFSCECWVKPYQSYTTFLLLGARLNGTYKSYSKFCCHVRIWIDPTMHKVLTCVEYRSVSGVFQTVTPTHPSPPSECVLLPHQRRGGTHSPGGEGGGGSIFWKTPDIGLASYSIISLRHHAYFIFHVLVCQMRGWTEPQLSVGQRGSGLQWIWCRQPAQTAPSRPPNGKFLLLTKKGSEEFFNIPSVNQHRYAVQKQTYKLYGHRRQKDKGGQLRISTQTTFVVHCKWSAGENPI